MAGREAQIRGETNPILTQFAVGYKPIQGIARLVAPIIKSLVESGTFYAFGKEGFMLYDTERALRTNAKKADFHLSKDTFLCKRHAFGADLDYDEIDEAEKYGAAAVLKLRQRSINFTQRILDIALEKAVADIIFSGTYYASGNKVTLTGTDKFSDYDNSDPIGVIDTGMDAARADMGIEPNTLVIGYTAWKTLRRHPQLLEKIKYSMKAILTTELVSEILEIDRVIVGKPVYATDASVFTDLWGDYAALIYVPVDANGNVLANEMIEGTTPHTIIIEEEGYPKVYTFSDKHVETNETERKYTVKNVSTSFGYLITDMV